MVPVYLLPGLFWLRTSPYRSHGSYSGKEEEVNYVPQKGQIKGFDVDTSDTPKEEKVFLYFLGANLRAEPYRSTLVSLLPQQQLPPAAIRPPLTDSPAEKKVRSSRYLPLAWPPG